MGNAVIVLVNWQKEYMSDGKFAVAGAEEIGKNIADSIKIIKDVIVITNKDAGTLMASSINLPQQVVYAPETWDNEFIEKLKAFDKFYVCGLPVETGVKDVCLKLKELSIGQICVLYNACRGYDKNIGDIAETFVALKKSGVKPMDYRTIFETG